MLSVSLIIRRLYLFFVSPIITLPLSSRVKALRTFKRLRDQSMSSGCRAICSPYRRPELKANIKVRFPVQRQRLDDSGLFCEGEGLYVFIRIALRQALESEKWVEVALPSVGDCCVLADHFQGHKNLVDGFVADWLATQAPIFGPKHKTIERCLVQV